MTTFLAENLQLNEIPKAVKNTIITVIDSHGTDFRSLSIAAIGLALTALQKQHQEIILDPSDPLGVMVTTAPYRNETSANVTEHFEKYAELLEKVYAEAAEAEAEAFVQQVVDAFYGPGTKIEGWQVTANELGQEPVVFKGGDVAGLNQLTSCETDRATENTDLNQGPLTAVDVEAPQAEQPAAELRDSMEAAQASKRVPCGGLLA